jgi:hypothetical protein
MDNLSLAEMLKLAKMLPKENVEVQIEQKIRKLIIEAVK